MHFKGIVSRQLVEADFIELINPHIGTHFCFIASNVELVLPVQNSGTQVFKKGVPSDALCRRHVSQLIDNYELTI